jgi:cytoskeletal protein RodZ
VNRGLLAGRSSLAGQFLLTGFFGILLCGFILFGRIHAQEVIVARETKPEASKQATPAAEETPSELPTQEPPKPKSREKKPASAEPTLEQMRMAGALAAERLNTRTSSQPAKARESVSEASPTATPVVSETARPAKKETRSEQTNESRRASGRSSKPGAIGPVRTTLMESGRTEPTATPLPRGETPTP